MRYYFRLMEGLEVSLRTFLILGIVVFVEALALALLMRRHGGKEVLVRVTFWFPLTLAAGLIVLAGYVKWQMGLIPLHIPFVRLQDGAFSTFSRWSRV